MKGRHSAGFGQQHLLPECSQVPLYSQGIGPGRVTNDMAQGAKTAGSANSHPSEENAAFT